MEARRGRLVVALSAAALLAAGCKDESAARARGAVPPEDDAGIKTRADAAPVADARPRVVLRPAPPLPSTPLGLPDLPEQDANPLTPEKVDLGSLLFSNRGLSGTEGKACSDCHAAERGMADRQSRAKTAAGKTNLRHTPTLYNIGYAPALFWDGRMPNLEALIAVHWRGQLAADLEQRASVLAADPVLAAHSQRAFNGPLTRDRIIEALASYVRTRRVGESAWDRYEAGDVSAVSDAAKRGFALFQGRAGCGVCHAPPLYTDHRFHNIYLPPIGPRDPGRRRVTGRAEDEAAFRTPGLRRLAETAPYFHDGRAATLEDALAHKFTVLDRRRKPEEIPLTAAERGDLRAFLETL